MVTHLKATKCHNSTQHFPFPMIPKPERSEFRCDSFQKSNNYLLLAIIVIFDMFNDDFCLSHFSKKEIQTGWGPHLRGWTMVPYGTIWYRMVPYGTIWYRMVPHGTIQYRMVKYGSCFCFSFVSYKIFLFKNIVARKIFSKTHVLSFFGVEKFFEIHQD